MNPDFQNIAEQFVQHYYDCYDNGNKSALCQLYHDSALMTFEGDKKQGKVDITAKLEGTNYKTQHAVTQVDSQPVIDGSIIVNVLGQIKTEGEDKVLGYTQTFLLKPMNNSFYIANDIFRLTLHNFAA